MIDFISFGSYGLVAGFVIGAIISNFIGWNRREDYKNTFTLSELSDMMAKRMIKDENEQSKEARTTRISAAIRDIVRKEFEE